MAAAQPPAHDTTQAGGHAMRGMSAAACNRGQARPAEEGPKKDG